MMEKLLKKYLLENYSEKNLSLILSVFYSFNKQQINNSIKLIINDSNSKYFLEIKESDEKDIYGQNFINYSSWNKRKGNINHFMIFSH